MTREDRRVNDNMNRSLRCPFGTGQKVTMFLKITVRSYPSASKPLLWIYWISVAVPVGMWAILNR